MRFGVDAREALTVVAPCHRTPGEIELVKCYRTRPPFIKMLNERTFAL